MKPHQLEHMDDILTEFEQNEVECINFPYNDFYEICHSIESMDVKYYDTDGMTYRVIIE